MAVKEVFPDCTYHQCVLHVGRDAKRIVRISLPNNRIDELINTTHTNFKNLFGIKD